LRVARTLLGAGANPRARPEYAQNSDILDVARGSDTRRDLLVTWLRDEVLPDRS
jgi:hypothetical protein